MNEACIWQYIFLGEVCLGREGGLKQFWQNIRRGGYLIIMLDYNGEKEGGGGGGGHESGKKWLHNKWVLLAM